MNQELKSLLQRYLQESEFFDATRGILRLAPTERDFSDELFDAFEPNVRIRIFPLLPVWCKEHAKAILSRRVKTEPDAHCRSAAEILLEALRLVRR
jgi:hypothetical protein